MLPIRSGINCAVFVQGLLNVDQLDRIHWIRVILDIIIINALVTAILPSALPLPS